MESMVEEERKEDEEISIDLSKITGFFKKKKKKNVLLIKQQKRHRNQR